MKLFIVLGFFALGSCMKKEELKPDYGPQISSAAVSAALIDALGEGDPTQIRKGEFRKADETQAIRGLSEIRLLKTTGVTVTERVENPNDINYTFVEEIVEYGSEGNRRFSREFEELIPKNKAAALLKPMGSEEETPVTYHNLEVIREFVTPPEEVVAQANCAGIANCKIRVTQVNYDYVVWTSANRGEMIKNRIRISRDVPFLSRVLDNCQTFDVEVQSQTIQATLCETVKNFMFGTN